jgi:hypothetical protein
MSEVPVFEQLVQTGSGQPADELEGRLPVGRGQSSHRDGFSKRYLRRGRPRYNADAAATQPGSCGSAFDRRVHLVRDAAQRKIRLPRTSVDGGIMTLDELVAQIVDPHEFVRLVNAVHIDMYPGDFQVIDGTRGDNGNDGYVASERRMIAIYCPVKPEQRRDADYRAKIESDLKKAIRLRDEGRYAIEAWTFITPRKLADEVVGWMRELGEKHGIRVLHQEAAFLAGELHRRPHLIRGFPTLAQLAITEKLDEILRLVRREQDAPGRTQRVDGEQILGQENRPANVPTDQARAERLEQLRSGYPTPEAKAELKALAYATSDPVVEVNAIHLLMRWWSPGDDDAAEFHAFAERAIVRSRQLGAHGSEAALHAQRAAITAFEMNRLLLEQHFSRMMSVAIGVYSPGEAAAHRSRMHDLTAAFAAEGTAATEILLRGASSTDVSSTFQILGSTMGQIAQTLRNVGATADADRYLAQAKKLLLAAKDASTAAGDELGAMNAMFNLANQIRFHGGEVEALALARKAKEVAEQHGDLMLRQKAIWLI